MITVQVEVANGRLPGGVEAGLARDRADFPFVQALGLSSFPFLAGVSDPEDLPLDYYSRLTADAPLPLVVIEGGWPSVDVAGVVSSPDEQRRYIERQPLMLEHPSLRLPGTRGRQPAVEAGAAGLGREVPTPAAAALTTATWLVGRAASALPPPKNCAASVPVVVFLFAR